MCLAHGKKQLKTSLIQQIYNRNIDSQFSILK